jgi:hypothetical protein
MQISLDATKVPLVGGEWTDAKLGVIAELELVPAVDAEGPPTVEAVDLSYMARWEPAETFGRTLTLEAHRRGVEGARDLASPNDGAEWIQGVLDYMAPHAVRILDEPHAAEHLGTIALLVYGERTPAATAWVTTQRQRLLEEDPAPVLAALEQTLADGPRSGSPAGPDGLTPQKWLAREVAFFQKRADQIRYAAFGGRAGRSSGRSNRPRRWRHARRRGSSAVWPLRRRPPPSPAPSRRRCRRPHSPSVPQLPRASVPAHAPPRAAAPRRRPAPPPRP